MRAVTFGKFALAAVAVVALCVMSAPLASADSVYDLSCGGTACGTVTVANVAANEVKVTVTMTGGFTMQAKGDNGFMFNTNLSSLTISSFTASPNGTGSAEFNKTLFSSSLLVSAGSFNDGGGHGFDYSVEKFGLSVNGQTSVSSISFILTGTGLSSSSFVATGGGPVLTVHYCSPGANGGADFSCPAPTGFTTETPGTTTPEPGSMALLGTGLLSLAGIVRRRLKQ